MNSPLVRRAPAGPSAVLLTMTLLPALNFAFASTVQLGNVDFKAGHPVSGESLIEATSYTQDVLVQVLETNARALKEIPQLGAEIAGFSDSHECAGRACSELSLRRARQVYEWLIEHGVPASKLKGPVADGNNFPLDESESEEARQLNRRVQFNLFRIDK